MVIEFTSKLPFAECCPGCISSWWGLCCGEDTFEEPNKTSFSEQLKHFIQFGK